VLSGEWGPDDPRVLLDLALLGGSLVELERFQEAEEVLKAVNSHSDTFMRRDPGWARNATSWLGHALWKQGKFVEAVELQRSNVEERAKSLGNDDNRTLAARLRLAIFLYWSRNYDEARVLAVTVLETKERLGCHDNAYEQAKKLLAATDTT
jgi:tetratricopeptide (TPR) repeat protein